MTNTITVVELMKQTRDSVDLGEAPDPDLYPDDSAEWWEGLIRVKASDTGFGHLVESILENGFDHNSPIGFNPIHGIITEGHHRIVAAILLCLDEIPYSQYGGGDWSISAHWSDDEYPINLY